ncbi:MAG TPA: Dam family site-specific DNA-(adenine-N6)-methyltransferase [Vicinamibacterales bacterium]|nr:Dam family site-specific DNA-(adenine-N6)-methyltransferase [Vicinamibacterales bacterium]
MPSSQKAQPFLKWAGGKRQLLPHLRRFYPPGVTRYVEPFLGSGAVFFDLWSSGRLRGARVLLSDENADLIGTYLRAADSTEALLAALRELATGHARGGEEHYYAVRDRAFNPARATWRTSGGVADGYPVPLAAMLVYMNRTGYNGLFRVNRRGDFNVPAGRYKTPSIVQDERIRAAAAALAAPGVCVRCRAFDDTLAEVGRGDLIYLDPPYAPLSLTANFRSYTALGFGDDDQKRLRDAVVRAARDGASILLSNSTAPAIVRLYEDAAVHRAGLRCLLVPARRAINSRASARGVIEELLVTNLPEAG